MFGSRSRYRPSKEDDVSPKNGESMLSNGTSTMSRRRRPKLNIRAAFSRKNVNHPSPMEDGSSPRDPFISPLGDSLSRPPQSEKFAPMSPVGEKKLRLMPKIAMYRGKGYLSADQERELYTLLEKQKANPFDTSALSDVDRKLEEYKASAKRAQEEEKPEAKPAVVTDPSDILRDLRGTRQSDKPSKVDKMKSTRRAFPYNESGPVPVEEEKIDISFDSPPTPYHDLPLNDRVILDPQDVFNQADEEFSKSLFVEMCFFARLGFLQPPTCLRCLYMESMEGMEQDLDCNNYVIWRRDANELLHPEAMDNNMCMLECQAARRLIEGEEVQDHNWDNMKRRLVLNEKGHLSEA